MYGRITPQYPIGPVSGHLGIEAGPDPDLKSDRCIY